MLATRPCARARSDAVAVGSRAEHVQHDVPAPGCRAQDPSLEGGPRAAQALSEVRLQARSRRCTKDSKEKVDRVSLRSAVVVRNSSTGIPLALQWYSTATALALSSYSPGTVLALYGHCAGTAAVPHQHCSGTALVQHDCYSTTGTIQVLRKRCAGVVLVGCWC